MTIEPGKIVSSGPDLDRAWRCGRLFVAVLYRADPRVRNAYAEYRDRNAALTGNDPMDPRSVSQALLALQQDVAALVALVDELELEPFKAWLPKALLLEFFRADGLPVEEMPPTIDRRAWEKTSKMSKNGPKQADPLPRDVVWYYRVKVKRPPDTEYAIGKEYARRKGLQPRRDGSKSQYSTVERAITRVDGHLAKLSPPELIWG